MRKIRLGKTFNVYWTILTNTEALPLAGRDLTLEMTHALKGSTLLPFTIEGDNVICVRIEGAEQTHLGVYSFTLWENYGKGSQSVVDHRRVFALVSSTDGEDDEVSDNIETGVDVTLDTANMAVGIKGDKGDPFRFEDFTEAQIAELQRPAIEAAEVCTEVTEACGVATDNANVATANANNATANANNAASNANAAKVEAESATRQAQTAAQRANTAAETAETETDALRAERADIAYRNRDNGWAATQTFGDIVVANIIQQGESYEMHAQQVYTTQDIVYLREGAESALASGQYVGLVARLYNGEDDGLLVYDNEGARVGKAGDTEPLLTRAEKTDMVDGAPLVWDAEGKRAVSGQWPQQPQWVYKEMEVTYEDDGSVEVFFVPTLLSDPNAVQ